MLPTIFVSVRHYKQPKECEALVWLAISRFCLPQWAGASTHLIDLNPYSTCYGEVLTAFHLCMQCTFINGSPQNALVPGVMELAEQRGIFVGGDDFKTGQTKLKSVLVDFLVSAGLKPTSIVSYNHLGNNDGKNLSAPKQFRSKEVGNCMCSITHIPK